MKKMTWPLVASLIVLIALWGGAMVWRSKSSSTSTTTPPPAGTTVTEDKPSPLPPPVYMKVWVGSDKPTYVNVEVGEFIKYSPTKNIPYEVYVDDKLFVRVPMKGPGEQGDTERPEVGYAHREGFKVKPGHEGVFGIVKWRDPGKEPPDNIWWARALAAPLVRE